MLRPLFSLAAAAAFIFAAVPAAAATLGGAERASVLAAASQALNGAQKLQGRFLQIGPDGAASEGAFYLQRPGKLRFDYDAPNPLTIVADGATVAIEDKALKSVDRMPLRTTPLYFVLKKNVDLEKDARITSVRRADGAVFVTARDRGGQTDGEIILTFDGPSLELRQWTVTDAQGQVTRLALKDVRAVDRLDPKLFIVKAPADPTARRRP